MSAFVHLNGRSSDFSPHLVPELIAELHDADGEHTDVAVTFDDHTVSVFPSLKLILEDVEGDTEPVHLRVASETTVVDVLQRFGVGGPQAVMDLEWRPGYGD